MMGHDRRPTRQKSPETARRRRIGDFCRVFRRRRCSSGARARDHRANTFPRACYLGMTTSSISGVKVSVSLPDEDVEFLDTYARVQGYDSRSAVLHKAVRLLRASELGSAYEDAWREWSSSGESEIWETTAGDGVST